MQVAKTRYIKCSHNFVNEALLQQPKSCTFFSRPFKMDFKEPSFVEPRSPDTLFILFSDVSAISLNMLSTGTLVKEPDSNFKIITVSMR